MIFPVKGWLVSGPEERERARSCDIRSGDSIRCGVIQATKISRMELGVVVLSENYSQV